MVRVILKKDLENLGARGDVVDVKPGHARNYLIPQGLATEASEANIRKIEEDRQRAGERSRRDYLEARRRAALLEGVSVTFQARAGEEGKLFGSVTSADIVDRLNQQGLEFEVDRRQVVLDEPLKRIGDFRVPIRLHAEVDAEIGVSIVRSEE